MTRNSILWNVCLSVYIKFLLPLLLFVGLGRLLRLEEIIKKQSQSLISGQDSKKLI